MTPKMPRSGWRISRSSWRIGGGRPGAQDQVSRSGRAGPGEQRENDVMAQQRRPDPAGEGQPNADQPRVNRLIHETSPYLLQHARNPVDWYPWGEEALQRARVEDRPILLSVGYSACH